MVNDKLTEIVNEIEPVLVKNGFLRRGSTNRFIRKCREDYRREELISFSGRAHRNHPEAIYISCTIGLYYPTVRKIYKCLIEDHLSKYPIVAGSVSHFSPRKCYLSVCYYKGINKEEVVAEIEKEIIEGGFCLTETFSNLAKIYDAYKNKHPYLYEYEGAKERISDKLVIVSIIYLLEGKNQALRWMCQNIDRQPETEKIFENMNKLE